MIRRTRVAPPTALFLSLMVLDPCLAWGAQPAPVSATQVQRLEDAAAGLETELAALHVRDPLRARSYENELQDLRDDIVYLRVNVRREVGAARYEYPMLQARIESLRQRIRATSRAEPGEAATEPAAAPSDADTAAARDAARAEQVLAQTRQALGGSTAIAALETLSADGTFRRTIGGNEVTGSFVMHLAMPDRFHRVEQPTLPSGAPGPRFASTYDGTQGWIAILGQAPGPDPGDAGRRGPPPDPTGRIRRDFERLMLGLLPGSAATAGMTFRYLEQTPSPEGDLHVLEASAGDGLVVQLVVDEARHLPRRLSFTGRDPLQAGRIFRRRPGETPEQTSERLDAARQRREAEDGGPPARVLIVWSFTDHRMVDGLLLPHRVTVTAGDKPVWDWHVTQFRVNPTLDPALFVKKGN